MQCQECRRPIASGSQSDALASNAERRRNQDGAAPDAADLERSPSSSAELRESYDLVRQSVLGTDVLGDTAQGQAQDERSKDAGKQDRAKRAGTQEGPTADGASTLDGAAAEPGSSAAGSGSASSPAAVPPASRHSLSDRLRLTEELAQLLATSPSPHAASLLPSRKPSSKAGSAVAATGSSPTGSPRKEPEAVLIDHELCRDCCNGLVELMRQQIDDLKREKDAYLAVEAELIKYRHEEVDVDAMQVEIEQLGQEEQELLQELRQVEEVKSALEAELREMDAEEKELEAEEESFWVSYSTLSSRLAALQNTHSALSASISHDKLTLARLQLTNVYNDAFCIGHDGGFATINGLRLGRLPGANVEWTEINAAWGQTALLLSVLARKCNFAFRGFVLHPKGSFSTIEKLHPDKAIYELHGSGDWQVARLLQSRRFDHGMVAFLECLRQLMAYAMERDSTLRLPHAVNKDRIGEACIRLQFGQDETWTRALRHVLLTLKVLMVWVLKVTDEDAPPDQSIRA
ncbi:Vacuolar protein sorting-associated protein atg6 [Tilletia horrida]|nr:Vacuolar protein sorting-associated protein atg6 [Tilletia horrida]